MYNYIIINKTYVKTDESINPLLFIITFKEISKNKKLKTQIYL